MRIVITGIGGYVGSYLAQEWRDDGHQIIGVDNWAWGFRDRVPEGCSVITADIRRRHELPNFDDIQLVVHCAAFASERLSHRLPAETWDINAMGSSVVGGWSRDIGARMIHMSTGAITSDRGSPYSASKEAAEEWIVANLPTASILRVWCLYGGHQLPHDVWRSVFAIWAESTIREGRIKVIGGSQSRCFTHLPSIRLPDVLMSLAPGARESYGHQQAYTLMDAAKEWQSITGATIETLPGDPNEPSRMGEVSSLPCPSYSLGVGLREYWEWYCSRGQYLPRLHYGALGQAKEELKFEHEKTDRAVTA